jgi:hypothetical protein
MKTADVDTVFTSASGDPIVANRKPVIKFRMLEKMIEYPVYIVDKLHEPFIMGIDFIKDMNLGYCPAHHEFFWTGNCPRDHVVTLGLKDAVTIPAFGKRRCKVKIANQKLAGKSVVASVLMEAQPWIRGGPILTDVDDNGDAWVEVSNASPITRELNKWDQVGHAEEFEMVCGLDEDGQEISSGYIGRQTFYKGECEVGMPAYRS